MSLSNIYTSDMIQAMLLAVLEYDVIKYVIEYVNVRPFVHRYDLIGKFTE